MPLWIEGHIGFAADIPIGDAWEVVSIGSFIGVDRDQKVEADVLCYDDKNRAIYRRSLHKETSGIYDSYNVEEVLGDGRTSIVRVEVSAHPTTGSAVRWHCTVTLTLYRKES